MSPQEYLDAVNAVLKSVKRHAIDDLEEHSIVSAMFDKIKSPTQCAIRIIAHRTLKRAKQLRIRTRTDA